MRPIWSGAISFGLIYIPVRLYNASQSDQIDFDLLRRGDQCPIGYAKVCKETGEEVPYEDIVKGFQYEKGKYVVIEDEDFKRANPRKTRTIEIDSFVMADEIDPKFLEKPYYVEPVEGAQKVYVLFRQALQRTKKAAIGRFVLRTREHLALLQAEGDVITLNAMRFAQEIRPPDELNLPEAEKASKRELDLAVKLIDTLTEPWEPEQYRDTYIDDLKRIIQQKIEGTEMEAVEEEDIPIEVTDLFSKLSESLEIAKDRKRS